jgi:hypothetical protein
MPRMKTVAVLCFIGLAVICVGQQHAPLLEQCKADLAVWYDDEAVIEYQKAEILYRTDSVTNRTDYAKLPIKTLSFRLKEMGDCWSVSNQDDRYYKAFKFYGDVRGDRYYHFIIRHHLMNQLLAEDEKGIRQ